MHDLPARDSLATMRMAIGPALAFYFSNTVALSAISKQACWDSGMEGSKRGQRLL